MGDHRLRPKVDIPFSGDAEVAEMVDLFERCLWPYERWTHRAHLALAVQTLDRFPFAEALELVRDRIRRYNRVCGDPDGYHETLTILFLRKVDRHLKDRAGPGSLCEAIEALARECDMSWPLAYYSAERLWSPSARAAWIEPDRRPLDF